MWKISHMTQAGKRVPTHWHKDGLIDKHPEKSDACIASIANVIAPHARPSVRLGSLWKNTLGLPGPNTAIKDTKPPSNQKDDHKGKNKIYVRD